MSNLAAACSEKNREPEGFRFRTWDTGIECLACGSVVDGIGYSIAQLAALHRGACVAAGKS